jgi:nitrate reductase molybdenum cofactor assembly chaperone NarJ/NarW
MKTQTHYGAARVLAALLSYPDADLRALLPELKQALHSDTSLSGEHRPALEGLIDDLRQADPLDAEARYVDTFDRGRRTSLHLFEHVHGDSRERGPALIDLQQTYAQQGLFLKTTELPDYLPVALEFAAMQPYERAKEFLSEMAHLLQSIHAALARQQSLYAVAVAAVLDLAGEPVQAVGSCDTAAEPQAAESEFELDEQWTEPAAFGGCSAAGQETAPRVQTIQVVRRETAPSCSGPSEGAIA